MATQDGIDNHYFSLIREVIKIYFNVRVHHIVKMHNIKVKRRNYFNVRVHHIVKMHNIKVKGRNVRHMYTKTIIFKGQ